MKIKSFNLISIILLTLTISKTYCAFVSSNTKTWGKNERRSVQLINSIAKDKFLNKTPNATEVAELKKLLPYIPKRYKAKFNKIKKTLEFKVADKKHLISPQPSLKKKDIPNIFTKPTEELKLKINIFKNNFRKTLDELLSDLEIPIELKDKYKKYLIHKTVTDMMKGQKLYPGPDSEKIERAYKNQKTKDKKSIQEIAKELYPKAKLDQLGKMARNRLTEEIIEKYIAEDLTNKDKQLAYRKKLRKKFKSKSKHKTKGYNIEKIEFLQTIK